MDFGSFLIAQSCFVSSFFMSLVNHKNDKFRWVLRSMIDLDIVAQYWKVWQFEDWKKKIIIPILPKNSVLGDNKRFGLVVTNSKNSVNTFFFLFFAFRIILHIIKKSQKKKFAQRNSLWKFSQKFTHFFFVMHTFAKAIIIFFVCTEPGWMDWKKNWDFSGRESQL